MTPKERHALADRLDQMAARNERTAKELSALGYGWANGAADLREAAAALREMPSTEEVVTAARASLWEQLESEAVERLTAEVERLRATIDMLRITLPRPDRLQALRSVWRDDHPISLVLVRVEAARALLDTEGGKT